MANVTSLGRVRALWALLLLVLAPLGVAGTLPAPKLREGQFVYRIPADFVPDKLSERGLAEIQAEARRLHFPFYVVFVAQLPTETGQTTDEDTERAIVGLADDWARDPKFDRNRSTLYLVSYGPGDRKYKMLPAPRWRAELGLEYGALDPYNEIFRSTARRDPQTALTRMMAAFDGYVFENVDPVRKAQRAEAERKRQAAARAEAARQAAALRKRQAEMRVEAARRAEEQRVRMTQGELANAVARLDTALRESPAYLPSDLDAYRSNVAQARRVLAANRLEAMPTWTGQLHRDAAALEGYAEGLRAKEAEERTRRTRIGLTSLAAFGLLLGAVAYRWRRIADDREKVRQRVETWRGWITQARQRYFLFDENRERAPHLREFGGQTADVYQATTREIDSIILGVEAVASLLDTAEAKARRATFLNRAPLNEALDALDKPVTFATDRVSDKLFEPVEPTIQVTPTAFLADLSDRYDAAVRNWQALNESVTRSLELPDALFPHTGLDALLDRAHAHGIPERWLARHPLIGDAESDRTLYAKVNEWRLTDPYAYARQIDELKAREATLAADLDRLIAAVALARSRQIEAVTGLGQTVLDPDDDPQITLDAASREHKRVAELLRTADSVETVEDQARKADERYAKTASQIAAAREAIMAAPLLVEQARKAYADAQALEGRANARAEQVAREHADVSAVRGGQSAAGRYLDSGAQDLAKAATKLQERRHVAALRSAQQATNQFGQAAAQMHGVLDQCTELDAIKARYEQRLAEMERLQRDAQFRMRRYDASPHLISDFRYPSRSMGPADFGFLLGMLQQQEDEWNAAVRRAEREYEEEQRRRREAEEEERRRHQASLYSSSSSSSSSFSSSDSGSSGGSFSSGGSGSSGGSW
jgi:uncharacterized membrane protein YgcG